MILGCLPWLRDWGTKEGARDQEFWRTGWKVKGHRGMRGDEGPKSLHYRAKDCAIKNIWWHFREVEKEESEEAEIHWHLHI